MNEYLIVIIAFLIALVIGFFMGKKLSKAENQTEKSILEERINNSQNQNNQLKEQFQTEKLQLKKILKNYRKKRNSFKPKKKC